MLPSHPEDLLRGIKCKWEPIWGIVYGTSCNRRHEFKVEYGVPVQKNGFKYCPYCGKEIEGI